MILVFYIFRLFVARLGSVFFLVNMLIFLFQAVEMSKKMPKESVGRLAVLTATHLPIYADQTVLLWVGLGALSFFFTFKQRLEWLALETCGFRTRWFFLTVVGSVGVLGTVFLFAVQPINIFSMDFYRTQTRLWLTGSLASSVRSTEQLGLWMRYGKTYMRLGPLENDAVRPYDRLDADGAAVHADAFNLQGRNTFRILPAQNFIYTTQDVVCAPLQADLLKELRLKDPSRVFFWKLPNVAKALERCGHEPRLYWVHFFHSLFRPMELMAMTLLMGAVVARVSGLLGLVLGSFLCFVFYGSERMFYVLGCCGYGPVGFLESVSFAVMVLVAFFMFQRRS